MVTAPLEHPHPGSGTTRATVEVGAMALAVVVGAICVERCGLFFGSFFAVTAALAAVLLRRGTDGMVALVNALPLLVVAWGLLGAGLLVAVDLGLR
ncbi:hypothetical protein [Nocardioides sp. YIM 152588]|uniref:hypothetical protein n=1 Tax=Nocardioides sp. YIM 152588 TaxID=3158259 RepID=UPI0032E36939